MIFSKIKTFFKDNKKIFYYFWFFIVVYMMSSEVGFAADNTKWEDIVWWVNLIFVVASVFIWLFTQLVSLFLNSWWINWSILGLDEHLKVIWIMVSNVVYFIFAFILIWIAFMNIIGKWEKWELKQALPKFVIWILIVPFSWFFVQFILSLSAILTVQVISLPFDSFPSVFNDKILNEKIIPNDCKINLTDTSIMKDIKTSTSAEIKTKIDKIYNCEGEKLSISQVIHNPDSIFWIISIYTYWILRIDKLDTLEKKEVTEWINVIIDLWIKWIIDILFVLVMLILIVSLWLALFTRWVWLWIYAMFSPIFWLLYFFDKSEWWWDWATKNFNIKEFINLALVPVYVAAALSFWLLFIFIASQWLTKSTDSGKPAYIWKDWISITLWDLKYSIDWAILGSHKEWISEVLGWLQWWVWSLIISIFWLVILWMAVMAALKSSTITWTVVEPIAQFGKQIWDLAVKSPQYAPVFGGMSAGWLSQAAWMVKTHYTNKSTQTWSDFINKHTPFWSETVSAKKVANEISTWDLLPSEIAKARKELAWKNMTEIKNDPNLKALVVALWKKVWTDEKLYSDAKLSSREWVAEALHDIHNSEDLKKLDSNRLFWSNKINQKDVEFINTKMAWLSSTWKQQQDLLNSENEPKLRIWETKTVININWWDVSEVTMKDWRIEKLWSAADNLAKYIVDNNISNLNELEKIELSEDSIKELNKYFYENKDWKIVFAKNKLDWYKNSSLEKFLNRKK